MDRNSIEPNLVDYPPVDVNDPLAKAVGLMFQFKCDVLPVLEEKRFVGVIKETALKNALEEGTAGVKRVWEVTDFSVPRLDEKMGLKEVLEVVKSHPQELALPVVSAEGIFKGMVRPRYILAEMADVIRPPRVGGMATPFGVHLHCGTTRGGSSDWQLLLTGSFLMVMVGVAWIMSFLVCWFLEKSVGVDLVPILMDSPALVGGEKAEVAMRIVWALPFLFFLITLRFTRVAQYHAAEHMVVHALERFEPLTEEGVRRMNRVHPRCGSNLMVPAFVLYMAWSFLPMANKVYFIGLVILMIATARNLGGIAQSLFTTRRPETKHIQKGIESARELIMNYRRGGNRPVSIAVRLWNMGLLQTLLGAFLAYGLFYGLRTLFGTMVGL
jgi:hypothetical protein